MKTVSDLSARIEGTGFNFEKANNLHYSANFDLAKQLKHLQMQKLADSLHTLHLFAK